MTSKDFKTIAAALASLSTEAVDERAREAVAYTLARTFAADNPRFDQAQFIAACEVYR